MRTAIHRHVEIEIVDPGREAVAKRIPILRMIDVLDIGLWGRPYVLNVKSLHLPPGVIFALRNPPACPATMIGGIVVVTAFILEDKGQ